MARYRRSPDGRLVFLKEHGWRRGRHSGVWRRGGLEMDPVSAADRVIWDEEAARIRLEWSSDEALMRRLRSPAVRLDQALVRALYETERGVACGL